MALPLTSIRELKIIFVTVYFPKFLEVNSKIFVQLFIYWQIGKLAKIDFSGLLEKHDSRSIFCWKPSHDQYGAYKKYPNLSSHTARDKPQTHRHPTTLKLIVDNPNFAKAGGVLSVGVLHRHNLKNIISKQFVVAFSRY